jgi:hypothetical protein
LYTSKFFTSASAKKLAKKENARKEGFCAKLFERRDPRGERSGQKELMQNFSLSCLVLFCLTCPQDLVLVFEKRNIVLSFQVFVLPATHMNREQERVKCTKRVVVVGDCVVKSRVTEETRTGRGNSLSDNGRETFFCTFH